jgi:ATP-dependent RNA helicase DDX46/PRP5
MVRHRNTRSPSPAGSQHSSKRQRRDEDVRRDRARRDDDGRGPRRRSRSRSLDVRYSSVSNANDRVIDKVVAQRRHRDRDPPRRRDRSVDHRENDYYRSGRRDRSRDRRDRYDRDRSPDRRRRRSRERDYRDRRDDSHDRASRHREDSTDWSRSRGDGYRGKPISKSESAKVTEVSHPYTLRSIQFSITSSRRQSLLRRQARQKLIRRLSD